MVNNKKSLILDIHPVNPGLSEIAITIPSQFVDAIFQEATQAQQNNIKTYGFAQGKTPLTYIGHHFKTNLTEHTKEFLLKYLVANFLYQEINNKKLRIAGQPRIKHIELEPGHDSTFTFEVSVPPQIEFKEWKIFPFKAPKRKRYKDIDRQVVSFVEEEEQYKKTYTDDSIHVGDIVSFDVCLLSANGKPVLEDYQENLWIKIGDEEADAAARELFVGKKTGDSFCTHSACLQDYFSSQLHTNYNFRVTIQHIIPCAFFCLENFKHHFRLKTNKEMHQKLIETFSYRNDISQRRAMAEEALKLLLSKHYFEIPNALVLRQQKIVLEAVQENPDYPVYKTEKNFQSYVKLLATKQIGETILIDQLAHEENVLATDTDITTYLNFLKRPRTKEFIYFLPPNSKLGGQETPIPSEVLRQCSLREKTLNHAIYHLTKK